MRDFPCSKFVLPVAFFPQLAWLLLSPTQPRLDRQSGHLHRTSENARHSPMCLFPYWKISAHMEKTVTSGNVNRERGLHSPSCQGLLSQLYFTVDSHKKKNWERFSCSPQHFPGRQGRSQDCRISDWKDTVGCCLLKALLLAGLLQR